MTKEKMMEILKGLENDIMFHVTNTGFDVTIRDFDGFDENWSAIIRKYNNPKKVYDFEKMLEKECISIIDDYYTIYRFNDFELELGYSSYDI